MREFTAASLGTGAVVVGVALSTLVAGCSRARPSGETSQSSASAGASSTGTLSRRSNTTASARATTNSSASDTSTTPDDGTASPPLSSSPGIATDPLGLIAPPAIAGDGIWAGPYQTCLLAGGQASCFGSNLLGASTGQHSYDRGLEVADMGRNLPEVDLGASCGVRAVATGAYHACALLEDGRVKCWGNNRSGELGLGDTNNRTAGAHELGSHLPAVDLGSHRATMITAGLGFSCALLDCGTVKCWGDNSYGSLGVGDHSNRGDQPGEMGDALPAVNLGTGRSAKFIAAGHAEACAILDDNSLKCWGLNAFGQLGQGDVQTRGASSTEMGDALKPIDLGAGHRAKSVAVAPNETCAVLENNSLKCWGFNGYGNLGLGDTAARGDGPNEMGDNLPAIDLGSHRSVRSLAMGGGFTCAVLDNYSLKCWGNNDNGTLGLGDRARRGDDPGEMGDALPSIDLGRGRTVKRALATFYNACAELDNGSLKCWGSSATGMLGIGPSQMRGDRASNMGDNLPSFDLGSCSIAAFSGGFPYHFGCALLGNGSVKCWGANSFGQLGVDHSSHAGDEPGDMGSALASVDVGSGRTVASIAPGNFHSCALLDNGDVKCWGANLSAALGQGDTMRRDGRPSYMGNSLPKVDLGAGRTATVLAVGSDHSCVILDNGAVKCWGDNSQGELGLGDENDRGDEAGEMGDALATVDLGSGVKAKALSLGYRHSCALLDNDKIKCWGWNVYGQLGLELGTGFIDNMGDEPGEMGDALATIRLGDQKPIAVYAGYSDTCAQFDDGSIKCWGDNSHGQLGLGDVNWRGKTAGSMGAALPAVDLGTGRKAMKLAQGAQRTCALLDDQTVKCWGYNAYGALGYGDAADRGAVPGQLGDALPAVDFGPGQTVLGLAASWYDNCVQLTTGTKCWGLNQFGQLGLGDTIDRGARLGQMGDSLSYVDLP